MSVMAQYWHIAALLMAHRNQSFFFVIIFSVFSLRPFFSLLAGFPRFFCCPFYSSSFCWASFFFGFLQLVSSLRCQDERHSLGYPLFFLFRTVIQGFRLTRVVFSRGEGSVWIFGSKKPSLSEVFCWANLRFTVIFFEVVTVTGART